jgi:hypothetical protein
MILEEGRPQILVSYQILPKLGMVEGIVLQHCSMRSLLYFPLSREVKYVHVFDPFRCYNFSDFIS